MSIDNQFNLPILTAQGLQINKIVVGTNYIAKLYIYIMIVVLLLMSGSALSAAIDDIKADMQGNNEAPLLNAPVGPIWAVKAYVGMGGAPRGDATPPAWVTDNPVYKSSLPWSAITPWFVIYPGVANAAKNVRIKVYGLVVHILEKSTNKWVRIDSGPGTALWAANFDFNLITWKSDAAVRMESDGNPSYKLTAESYPIHGGFTRQDITKYIADPSDIAAVFVHLKTQLILDNPTGADDRASAQILVNVGADYYPSITTKVSDLSPMQYVPAVGGSRFGLVKTVPRSHYMATIDPPGTVNKKSAYALSGGMITIPDMQFEENMPSYLFDTVAPSVPTSLNLALKKYASSAVVSLSWKESTDNVAVGGYSIYRNGIKIGASTSASYADTIKTTATGALYSYAIKAFDDAGNLSSLSSTIYNAY